MDGYWKIRWIEHGGWHRTALIYHEPDAIKFINEHPGCAAEYVKLPKIENAQG